MKSSFKLALKIYKYLAITFAIAFYVYLLVDDYSLAKYNEGASDWAFFIAGHFIFVIVYSMVGAIYYWALASIAILVYHKLFKSKRKAVDGGN